MQSARLSDLLPKTSRPPLAFYASTLDSASDHSLSRDGLIAPAPFRSDVTLKCELTNIHYPSHRARHGSSPEILELGGQNVTRRHRIRRPAKRPAPTEKRPDPKAEALREV